MALGPGPRGREIKSGALIDLGFRPDAAAVFVHDALDRGQADARAFEFVLPMQALKNAEEFVGKARIEPRTVVADKKYGPFFFFPASHLDDRAGYPPRELDGVRKEIGKHLAKQHRVSFHFWESGDFPMNRAVSRFG